MNYLKEKGISKALYLRLKKRNVFKFFKGGGPLELQFVPKYGKNEGKLKLRILNSVTVPKNVTGLLGFLRSILVQN